MAHESSDTVRVLAVDDERFNLDLLKRALGRFCSLELYADPVQAQRALATGDFVIVITDFMMPVVSGTDIARAARGGNPNAIVMVVSAFTDTKEVIAAHEEGVIDIMVTKPWRVSKMREELGRALLMAEMRRRGAAARGRR